MAEPVSPTMSAHDMPERTTARPPVFTRICRRNVLLGLGVIIAACGGVIWHEARSDALLTRIHHGRILCASGSAAALALPVPPPPGSPVTATQAATVEGEADSDAPPMLWLNVARMEDGRLVVREGGLPLSDALIASRHAHRLVMLALHDVPATRVTQVVRATGMRHRVVLTAADEMGTQDALKADRSIIVAIPVRSVREEQAAKRLAKGRRFAAYLPADAAPELFELAHREAAAVIADVPGGATDVGRMEAFLNLPVDILVTDHPDRLANAGE